MTVTLSVEPATASDGELRLRPWRSGDVLALLRAHRDPALRRWLTTTLHSEADARRWIDDQSEGWATGTQLSFAVLECGRGSDAGRLVGHVVVKWADRTSASAEVGYWTSAEVRGRGIASRALEAVSRWGLVTPLTRLYLIHASGNHASCRVAEKCRYVLDSILPPQLPAFPTEAHLHVRTDDGSSVLGGGDPGTGLGHGGR
jgi:RimJ/RimL family protein N-acetyltransferase